MMDLITGCWCHKIKCSGPLRMGTHGRRVDGVTSGKPDAYTGKYGVVQQIVQSLHSADRKQQMFET